MTQINDLMDLEPFQPNKWREFSVISWRVSGWKSKVLNLETSKLNILFSDIYFKFFSAFLNLF
jgi:hypothetical protein